ncbi:MAG: SOS response-associated peptidase [Bacteroidota bacterium]|nr:SOS response-associated peptidase [Bacteroidota bacterium]
MCFFTKLVSKPKAIENRFEAKFDLGHSYQSAEILNGFSFPKQPVILDSSPSRIQEFYWGLVPHWANDLLVRKYTLNAKIETLNEKPSFRASQNKRCLVVVDGFYEWQWLDSKGKEKQKYFISAAAKAPFALGGIWASYNDANTGETYNSYSVVTTPANKLMSKIHNTKQRMPVIITQELQDSWLNTENTDFFAVQNPELTAIKVFDNFDDQYRMQSLF